MAFGDVLQTPDLARAEQCSILSVHSMRRIQLRTLIFKYISNQLGESFNTAEYYKLPLSIYYMVNSTTPSSPKNHTQAFVPLSLSVTNPPEPQSIKFISTSLSSMASLAQWLEHWSRKPGVESSNLSWG